MKKMAAGSFKVHCLAVMDEVQAKHETFVITKHGKPVAKLVPVNTDMDEMYNFLAGKGAVVVAWLAFDQHQISRKARAAIDNARRSGDGLAVSDITLLELATLASKGHIQLDISLESF